MKYSIFTYYIQSLHVEYIFLLTILINNNSLKENKENSNSYKKYKLALVYEEHKINF